MAVLAGATFTVTAVDQVTPWLAEEEKYTLKPSDQVAYRAEIDSRRSLGFAR